MQVYDFIMFCLLFQKKLRYNQGLLYAWTYNPRTTKDFSMHGRTTHVQPRTPLCMGVQLPNHVGKMNNRLFFSYFTQKLIFFVLSFSNDR